MKRLLDWFEERTGLVSLGREALEEHIPGGPKWAYVFGSGLLIIFVLQAVTGVLLGFYYSPSATDAWGSVWYIQHELSMGWLLRGMHHFGASAMVVLCALHMTQVFLYGAYKKPREVNWITGVTLLGLVLGFSLTGYLLPWDQKGYWATRVATNIVGSVPVVGEWLQAFVQGGSDYGNLTLTRFYALHVFVLPIGTVGLIGLHVWLFRHHGVTPDPKASDEELERTGGWFYPVQLLKDVVFGLLIVALLIALTIGLGAPLDAPADPASQYDARPEWYYLALFQLLKYFEGPLVLVGAIVIPGIVSLFLIGLPFLDRSPDRRLASRKLWAVLFFATVAGVLALTAVAMVEDATDEAFQEGRAVAARNAAEAVAYAASEGHGIDARGTVVLYAGKSIFRREKCDQCHEATEPAVEEKGPSLRGFLSRAWIRRFLLQPSHPKHFGKTKLKYDEDSGDGMPPTEDLSDEELAAIVELIASQSGETYDPPIDEALVKAGEGLFEDGDCSGCHGLAEAEENSGPFLGGFGGRAWLSQLLENPSHDLQYGDLGDGMPRFDHLSPRDVRLLSGWVLNLRNETDTSAGASAEPAVGVR